MRFTTRLACIVLLFNVSHVFAQGAWLTTVAGGGEGENQPATSIGLRVNSVAIDSKGNIFIADHTSNIKKIDAQTGLVTLVKLNTSTVLYLFIDQHDNLFIADAQNHKIQKYSLGTSTLTTIAGTGASGFSGDGGQAIDAKLSGPKAVFVDESENIFIIDGGNNRIRKINNSGVITTIAGNGTVGFGGDGGQATSAMLNNPLGLAKDLQNNLYIGDYQNNRIRKVDLVSGIITTIAGFGPSTYNGDDMLAVNAGLYGPAGLYFDGNNFLYVADRFNRRIRKINLTTGYISLVAGNGMSGSAGDGGLGVNASMAVPSGIAADKNNNLFIADDWEYGSNGILRKISLATNIITTVAGNKGSKYCCEGITALQAQFANISGITLDANGNILIADIDENRIRKVDKQGIVTTIAGNGLLGSSGNGGDARQAQLSSPKDVKTDNAGNIYVTESWLLRKITPDNIITTIAGNGTGGTAGDGGLASNAQLDNAHGLHVDANGNIYIAQFSKVRKIDASTGIITTIAGGGTGGDGGLATNAVLNNIQDIAVDRSGNLFIAEFAGKIRKVAVETGIISTVAGNGTTGFSGDGGLAINAQLSMVSAVAVDQNNNIYIGDAARVRRIGSDGVINTVAGDGSYGWSDNGYFATLTPIGRTSSFALDEYNNVVFGTFFRVKKLYQNKLPQTISFNALPAKTFGDAPFDLSATVSSGLIVKFSSSNNSVATVSGNKVTIVGAGTSTITAYQQGDMINKEVSTTQILTVNKNSQLITFNTIPDKTIGDPSFDLAASVSSGLTISFATTSTNISINAKTVTLNKPGRVTITASQAGNENYNAATPVARSFCVSPAKPNITTTESLPITLTSSNGQGNQWYKNGELIVGATSNTLEVSDTGDYTVVTSIDGCQSLSSDAAHLIIAGIAEHATKNIAIYPNPVSDIIVVTFEDAANAKVAIFDLNGMQMSCKAEIVDDTISINVSNFATGLYLLQIQTGKTKQVSKVFKK